MIGGCNPDQLLFSVEATVSLDNVEGRIVIVGVPGVYYFQFFLFPPTDCGMVLQAPSREFG